MDERKVWFVTRPERDPKFHRDALLALRDSTDNFAVKWTGNREAHLNFEKKLNEYEVKRDNVSADGSGGRTWAALLKTFSYIYTDNEGYIHPTKSALKIMAGEKVRENVIKQILTLQIPNAYFLDSGFRPKYKEDFRIRPVRFLIKLVNQKELDYYLTKEEITFFALTTQKDNQLIEITNKILTFRNASSEEKEKIKDNIADEYDHRERSDNSARDFKSAHGDVAHTFMMLCEYTELVEYQRGGKSLLSIQPDRHKYVEDIIKLYDEKYPFNTRYLISLERLAENNGLDIDSYKAKLSSITAIPASNKNKTERKIRNILADYPAPSELSEEELRNILSVEFSEREISQIVGSLHEYVYQALSEEFVDSYLNEQDNLLFEDKTGEVLKAIGFDVVMRPKPVNEASTEVEILIKYGSKEFAIIDAKNYRKKFTLPANLVSHMASEYIPNYEGYEKRMLAYFGYVTAADIGGEKNIAKISELAKRVIKNRTIKGFMINAQTLIGFLDYCIENGLSKDERIELFLKAIDNKAYTSIEQMLKDLHAQA